jgi:hypothetical protein
MLYKKQINVIESLLYYKVFPGADPGFQVRGGALKKFAPNRGRRENFWGFRVKNHDFTPCTTTDDIVCTITYALLRGGSRGEGGAPGARPP